MRHLRHLRAVEPAPKEPVSDSDEALMLAVSHNDGQAFGLLLRRYEAKVRRFCRVCLGSADAAEDVAQETFLRLWRGRGRYRADGRFRAFLYTIARNLCRNHLRANRLRAWVGLGESGGPSAPDPDELGTGDPRYATLHHHRVLRAALGQLDPKYSIPVALRFLEGLEYSEIACVIGRTEATARSRVHFGLKQLAQIVPVEVLS